MKLVASAIVHNEASRYLEPWLAHLVEFCDEIRIIDDASTDGTGDILRAYQGSGCVALMTLRDPLFDVHEGQARQRLLDWTMQAHPDVVVAIDADEFIGDGAALRALLEQDRLTQAWTVTMTEVWNATRDGLGIRMDGAWGPYERIHLWRAPTHTAVNAYWRIPDRKLACSPIPTQATKVPNRPSGQRIYHFGWADPSTRQARYDRYMRLDGGKFHARSHLQSIIWPENRVRTEPIEWPAADWADTLRRKLVAA